MAYGDFDIMEQQYLTVKQFAERAGVSTQRVYQLLTKSLQEFTKTEHGKKYISIEGLRVFEKDPLQDLAKDLQSDLPSTCKEETPGEIVSLLQSTLDLLQQQLTEKDKQISSLLEQIKTKDKQIGDLTERLTAAQALHAGTLREHLETAPEARQSRGADEDNTGGAAAADQSTEGDQAPLPEKKSLFQRIFGRKRRF